jgi:hypothetical protein
MGLLWPEALKVASKKSLFTWEQKEKCQKFSPIETMAYKV